MPAAELDLVPISLQGNYIWNRNDLILTSTAAPGPGPNFYQQPRSSRQNAFIADLLVYMRDRRSRVRRARAHAQPARA